MRGTTWTTAVVIAVLLSLIGAAAQDRPKFADSQKRNRDALLQYTWKSRTEIKVKGESKNVKLEQVRYDLDGKLQKTPLGGSPPPAAAAAPARGGRLAKRVVANKKEEFAKELQELGQLVASYGQLPPEKTQQFAQTATMAPDDTIKGTVRIQGANVLQSGDSLTVWVDQASQMMRKVEIKTAYDGKPAALTAEYRDVPNGPTYMARAQLTYPSKQIELTVDNYEYEGPR